MAEEQKVTPRESEAPDDIEHMKPVVRGKVAIKKKSPGRKLIETFFAGDIKEALKSAWEDLAVPAMKDMMYGALDQAFRGLIYEDYSGRNRRRDRDRGDSRREDFSGYSRRKSRPRDEREDVYDIGELFFEDKRDADDAEDSIHDLLDRYKAATVGQLFEIAGLTVRRTDYNYGWRAEQARDIYVTSTRGGYILKTPRPKPLD